MTHAVADAALFGESLSCEEIQRAAFVAQRRQVGLEQHVPDVELVGVREDRRLHLPRVLVLEPPEVAVLDPVQQGGAILVGQTRHVDDIHRRAVAEGANVVSPPLDWEVPSHDGSSVIRLRTMSMFDRNGIYSEINQHG